MSSIEEHSRHHLDLLTVEEARSVIDSAVEGGAEDLRVVVDFDETLWLRNTTEEYLASLRPRLLAHAILLVVDLVRPWALLRTAEARRLYRDWIRTLACTLLMPWSLAAWRHGAAARAERWKNRTLLDWLTKKHRLPLHVATLGLGVLVEPILRHIDPGATLVAAGSFWSGYRIRSRGKQASIDERHAGMVANAIVITDSEHDADLLAAAHTPVLVKWPAAEYRPAFARSYLPFLYTQKAKRPGENYMLYGFLLEDVVHLWLAFAWIMAAPLVGALALLLLHLSFWAVYELGYVENDVLAVRHESKPKTFAEAAPYAARMKPVQAWAWALVLALPALGLLLAYEPHSLLLPDAAASWRSFSLLYAVWIAYLAAQRASFWIYNRLDTGSRGLFYVVLQVVRLSGYAVLLRVNAVGAVLLLSLVMARWVKYIAYRDTGRTLAESQRLLSLAFFFVMSGGILATDPAAFFSLQGLAALVWLAIYSHRRLRDLSRSARLHLA